MAKEYHPQSVDAVLARIESRQLSNAEKLDTTIASLEALRKNHEKRIASLEKAKVWVLGAASAIGFVGHAAWEYLKGNKQ